jgi:NAD(P)-dependent dehydrogenase (short-subunit alcohol dehydrogenase family)
MTRSVCVVAGVGEGNGAALARAFSNEGMALALLARRADFSGKLAEELPDSRAYACNVSDADSVAETFDRIRRDLGDPETVVYNAGSGVWLARQPRSAWTFEIEVRPFGEKW